MPKVMKKKKAVKKLTQRQITALKNHSVHHSPRHMASMRKDMRDGMTFGMAHKRALRKVGV